MRQLFAVGGAMVLATALAATVNGNDAATTHSLITDAEIVWRESSGLNPGARIAVVSGNPGGPGAFTIRLQLPAGYEVRPH
jgi:hypothetical protein